MSYRTTEGETKEIIRLWLCEHKSYPEIAKIMGRGLATISKIVNEYRESNPDIDKVREVIARVATSKKTIPDVLRAQNTLDDFEKIGITYDQISQCWNLLKVHREAAPSVLESGVKVDALANQTGLKPSEIERRYRTWENTKASIVADEERKRKLQSEIVDLEGLKQLQEDLKANHIEQADLRAFIEVHKTLKALKFTPQSAKALAGELASKNLTVEEGARKVAEMIQEYGSTTRAIEATKNELRRLEERKTTSLEDLGSIEHNKEEMRRQLALVVNGVFETGRQYTRLSGEKQALENEISALNRTKEEKKEEIVLADSFLVLVTDPRGLTTPQLDLIISRLNEAREYREKKLPVSANQELESADLVLSNYLVPRLNRMITDLQTSKNSLARTQSADQLEKQQLLADSEKREKILQNMDSFFTGIAPGILSTDEQLGYDCPKCKGGIFLTTKNTRGSIVVTCGNCRKPSSPSLMELYRIVLKNA